MGCLFGVVYVCMLTVSYALLMSSATVIVHSGGLFWLKRVAMVLFMLCGDMWDIVCFSYQCVCLCCVFYV